VILKEKLATDQELDTDTDTALTGKVDILSPTKPKEKVNEKLKSFTAIIPKLREKIKLKEKMKIKEKVMQTPGTVTKIGTPPKIPTVTTNLKSPDESKVPLIRKARKILDSNTAFEVQVKRKGKFQRVSSKPLPQGKALQLGVQKTTTTLGQTFRLVKKGITREKDITYSVSNEIFTKPKKKTANIEFVERRGKTLKKGTGEVPAIFKAQKEAGVNLFKKKKKKKKSTKKKK